VIILRTFLRTGARWYDFMTTLINAVDSHAQCGIVAKLVRDADQVGLTSVPAYVAVILGANWCAPTGGMICCRAAWIQRRGEYCSGAVWAVVRRLRGWLSERVCDRG